MKVWKVVGDFESKHTGSKHTLVSCIAGLHAVKYEIGKAAVPKKNCGPLAAFKTRKDARAFRAQHIDVSEYRLYPIYKAEASPSKYTYLWYENIMMVMAKHDLPSGTILCDSITLLEEAR